MIEVVGKDCELHFKVKPTTKMGKMKNAYSEKVGVAVTSLRFMFGGRRIGDNETAKSLGLQDDDVIEVDNY